jgi:hypothetical protein
MNLYIQIKNGQPFEHPILEDNFIETFPNLDVNNLPPEFARFRRITVEDCGISIDDPSKKLVMTDYRLANDGFWEDVWEAVDKDVNQLQRLQEVENEEKLNIAIGLLSSLKNKANEIYDALTNESEKQAWDTYFSKMSFENPITHDITIPKYPIKNEEGKYIPNLDENGNWVTRILYDGQ